MQTDFDSGDGSALLVDDFSGADDLLLLAFGTVYLRRAGENDHRKTNAYNRNPTLFYLSFSYHDPTVLYKPSFLLRLAKALVTIEKTKITETGA
jgi:hypothetical protein